MGMVVYYTFFLCSPPRTTYIRAAIIATRARRVGTWGWRWSGSRGSRASLHKITRNAVVSVANDSLESKAVVAQFRGGSEGGGLAVMDPAGNNGINTTINTVLRNFKASFNKVEEALSTSRGDCVSIETKRPVGLNKVLRVLFRALEFPSFQV